MGFLRGRSVYLGQPAEDWVQRCQIHWSQQRDKYDAARGASLRTFLHRVIDMRLRELARELQAEKRTPDREAQTLDAPARPTEGRAVRDTLTSGDDPEGEALQGELRRLLRDTAQGLSPLQQRLLGGLAKGLSMTELSRELGVPRATLYLQRDRIRDRFHDAGLDDFLR